MARRKPIAFSPKAIDAEAQLDRTPFDEVAEAEEAGRENYRESSALDFFALLAEPTKSAIWRCVQAGIWSPSRRELARIAGCSPSTVRKQLEAASRLVWGTPRPPWMRSK